MSRKVIVEKTFIKRITDQARYLEGDLIGYLLEHGMTQGMKVLELGSCIGLHSREVAKAVYPGKVFSLEKEETYLLYQKQCSRNTKRGPLLVEGDALSLPFRDKSFDFAYSRFLFQHLEHPQKTMIEVRRVLRDKAKFLVIDTDDYYDTYYPELPVVGKAYKALTKLQRIRGGDRYVGRRLFYYMVHANFKNIEVRVVPTIQVGLKNKELLLKDIIPMFNEEYSHIIARNLIGKSELDKALSSIKGFALKKDSFYLGLIFILCGEG